MNWIREGINELNKARIKLMEKLYSILEIVTLSSLERRKHPTIHLSIHPSIHPSIQYFAVYHYYLPLGNGIADMSKTRRSLSWWSIHSISFLSYSLISTKGYKFFIFKNARDKAVTSRCLITSYQKMQTQTAMKDTTSPPLGWLSPDYALSSSDGTLRLPSSGHLPSSPRLQSGLC